MLPPPVPGANVTPDHIMLLDDELDALDSPVTNDLSGGTVSVQPLEFCHYCCKDMCLSAEQIAAPTILLVSLLPLLLSQRVISDTGSFPA